jgi:hypothetical protein
MQVHKFLLSLFLFVFCLLPSLALAEAGEKFTQEGYSFDVSADQMGSEILVRGMISGGESCKKLIATIQLQDENSHRTSVKVIVNDYGSRERFSLRKPVKAVRTSRWTVSNVSIHRFQ